MNYNEWVKEIDAEEAAHKGWRKKAETVQKVYRLKDESSRNFSILWPNVEVLRPACYSATPRPDVRKRFFDQNEAAKDAASVLEKALSFTLDQCDFDGVVKPCVTDFLVSALGQVRVSYEPYFAQGERERVALEVRDGEDGPEYYDLDDKVESPEFDDLGPYIEGDEIPELVEQRVSFVTVPWDRFLWQPAKDWESVRWVGEVHFLDDDEIKEKFGDVMLPMEFTADGVKRSDQRAGTHARVLEIFDKAKREHFAICIGYPECLYFRDSDGEEIKTDELGLSGFWPYPKPLFANTVAGELIPVPDYCYYQGLAEELNEVSRRIEKLTGMLKYRGVYDSSFEDSSLSVLADVQNASDGEFQPVPNMAAKMAQAGGRLDAIIAAMPLDEIRAVVMDLVNLRGQIKQAIYEITGISDIVRGSTKATETLGAQQMKGQFANMRLSDKQGEVERFCRDLLRIAAEIIGEHFEPEILEMMTGVPVTDEIVAVLRSDVLRAFNVDVETDSTIIRDANEEQRNRTEAVKTMIEGMAQLMPMVQQGLPLPLAVEILQFGLSGYKLPKALTDALAELSNSDGAVPADPGMGGEQFGMPVSAGLGDIGPVA